MDELQQAGTLPIAVEPDFEQFIAGRRMLLDARLAAVDARAKDRLLPDVSIEPGVLKIAPIDKSTPPEAEALAARLYAMLPRVRITDLMAEVAGWTLFLDCLLDVGRSALVDLIPMGFGSERMSGLAPIDVAIVVAAAAHGNQGPSTWSSVKLSVAGSTRGSSPWSARLIAAISRAL